jgi:signal transduction histidine kinase
MTKILIIEDNASIRENILEMLIQQGFEVFEAENGQIGLELALKHLPDLILCDVIMPELDGYGVLEKLRQNSETATIPFIFLTALSDRIDARKAMELGADDYVTKPCSLKSILKAVNAQLKKQSQRQKESEIKLEELKENISYFLPHEIRTPLNGILGCSTLLMSEWQELEELEIEEMLDSIANSAKRLYRLMQNFLLYKELKAIASNTQKIERLRGDRTNTVAQYIAEVAVAIAKEAKREKDLQLELTSSDRSILIASNMLRKLLEELISNAFKFSPSGTQVKICSSFLERNFILSVTDRGRGITPEQIERVGAYVQFDRKIYEQQGSGLGLIIAKSIAEIYGGSLQIESIPNQETKVDVYLPLLA